MCVCVCMFVCMYICLYIYKIFLEYFSCMTAPDLQVRGGCTSIVFKHIFYLLAGGLRIWDLNTKSILLKVEDLGIQGND